MHAALVINLPNNARAIVTTQEITDASPSTPQPVKSELMGSLPILRSSGPGGNESVRTILTV